MTGTIILVHGAWHGAWCWERVVPALTARGVDAIAVDLPGHGADDGPMTDLHGDAARVVEVLDALEVPAVLVGHSYGGAVVTAAGDHPMVASLVFVAALVIDAGETCMQAAVDASEAARISWEDRPNLADGFVVGPDGMIHLDRVSAQRCLYNDCDDDTASWALDRLGPHPLANLDQQPHRVAWRAKGSTYVVCTEDHAVHPDLQRVLAPRCSAALEWPTGHSPFLSRPDLVVDLLAGIAGDLSG
jgi:pimeloyl-ACP methyl ester carboxylesterase